MIETVSQFFDDYLSLNLRLHPAYFLPFLAVGFLAYLYHKKNINSDKGFWQWLFPKEIYFHKSHLTDIKLFFLGQILTAANAFNTVIVMTFFASLAMIILEPWSIAADPEAPLTLGQLIITTIIMTMVSDLRVYIVHRLHHDHPVLWPYHSVHHSAEVMTPVTVYRKHPVYDFISSLFQAALTGVAQGIVIAILFGKVEIVTLAGINTFYFVFNIIGSNFRHSHVWISYGKVLEHIFISPAQHQIHHSLRPEHHNKNYGEILAIWDWMFGTLYIPDKYEVLEFGLADTKGNRLEQPHKTLQDALVRPFQDSQKAIKKRRDSKRALRQNKTGQSIPPADRDTSQTDQ